MQWFKTINSGRIEEEGAKGIGIREEEMKRKKVPFKKVANPVVPIGPRLETPLFHRMREREFDQKSKL